MPVRLWSRTDLIFAVFSMVWSVWNFLISSLHQLFKVWAKTVSVSQNLYLRWCEMARGPGLDRLLRQDQHVVQTASKIHTLSITTISKSDGWWQQIPNSCCYCRELNVYGEMGKINKRKCIWIETIGFLGCHQGEGGGWENFEDEVAWKLSTLPRFIGLGWWWTIWGRGKSSRRREKNL